MSGRNNAFNFMNIVIESLSSRKIDIVYIDHDAIRFETRHTKVWFTSKYGARSILDGIQADAIFGELYPELEYRAKPDAVIASRDGIGLVDYIYRIERMYTAVQKITDALYDNLGIKKAMVENAASEERYRAYYKHCIKPFIIRDEPEAYLESLRPKMYITTAGGDSSEFYRRYMGQWNVHDNLPADQDSARYRFINGRGIFPHIVAARGNGKSMTSLEHLINEINKIKGEEIMTKIMNDIAQGKPVRLSTIGGMVPVKIESIETRKDAPTKFTGYVITPEEDYVRHDLATGAYLHSIMREVIDRNQRKNQRMVPAIRNVHFSGPCTVVIWNDKTKTIVRCKDGEKPDYEKGLAMAIAKKVLGTNKSGSNYYDIFKQWLPKPEEEEQETTEEEEQETTEEVVEEVPNVEPVEVD